MGFVLQSFVVLLCFTPAIVCQVTEFVSIDCGSASNYTDTSTGLAWTSDAGMMGQGKPVVVVNANVNSQQYQRRRDFPADSNKYCYTLKTKERRRYLVRATFLYGSPAAEGTYPKFELYLDATKWGTITISESSRIYVNEMIIRAPSNSIDVCLCCATTESPFISTLELRPLNLSMYATDYEDNFYLKVAARVDFGAQSKEPIRYPDDPYDRIWDSDLKKRPNFLVDVAAGTERINTTKYIDTNTREYPPVKVMQTAVVGTKGMLSYRLNLDDFPATARAFAYFAEIEDLGMNETRKFKMEHPYVPDYSNAVVNIAENANGSYTLYEPSYMNITLDFILSFSFVKTPDSTRGPLLSAMEICRYVQIATKTDEQDVSTLNAFRSMSLGSDWSDEDGDPCVPTQWEWVTCSTTSPPRITKITLSGKNVTGEIPRELQHMEGLTELWLDGNSLTGPIPDMSNLVNLRIIHLENNKLTGPIPSYLGGLPSLLELDVQNNSLTGEIPSSLLTGKVTFKHEGNPNLRPESKHSTRYKVILGASIGGLVIILVLFAVSIFFLCHFRTKVSHQKGESMRTNAKPSTTCSMARGGSLMDEGVAYYIPQSEIEEATENFSKKIGKGSFGPVYYGRLGDGKEVAVKTMADSSSHGTKQFATEVALLSRIHHRNLVPLIGYYEDDHQRMLVYEYMHNGTLRDHITESTDKKHLDWLARLNTAEDAAKGYQKFFIVNNLEVCILLVSPESQDNIFSLLVGLEYLHTGCNPSIIHRDVKTSNILLDINMRAKVSDFGLSRQAEEDLTHVSSVARGTVGYLDPEYYANQQLTEKSDVYSFGVVLLELISGRKPFSSEEYGADWSIVHWARSLIRKGDVISIMDPALVGHVKVESVWRIAEVAIQCVERHGTSRPRMHEILSAIQDAIKIEKGIDKLSSSGSSKAQSSRKTLLTSFLDVESPDISNSSLTPSAR